MDVAAIIVNYRTAEATIHAVSGLYRELEGFEDPRIIVVDNDSGDGSFERLERELHTPGFAGRVSVIASGHNGGYGFGINLGAREAMGLPSRPRYVYVINPDASPDPGALRELVDFADARPDAGLVGNLVYSPSGERLKAFRFPSILGELEGAARIGILTRLLRRHRVTVDAAVSGEVDWVAGASMLIRSEVFSTVGLFDEGFFLYFEEVDFARRVWQKGWKVYFSEGAGVDHIGSLSTGMKDESRRMPQYWFESRRRYLVKHHGRLYGAVCDAAWISGHALCALKLKVQGKSASLGRRRLGSDFLAYSLGNLWKAAPDAKQNAGVPRTRLFTDDGKAPSSRGGDQDGAPNRDRSEQGDEDKRKTPFGANSPAG